MAAPADPADLTLRQLQLLGAADTILFDAGVAPAVLDRARADASRIELGADDEADRPGLTIILRGA